MTWLKLSDDFGDHLAELSDSAFRTHVEALLWVMRRETGGSLTARDVRRFAETSDPEAAVQELLARGLWITQGTGYRVEHHLEHQPTRAVLKARRDKDAARQARHRSKRAGLDDDLDQPERSRRDTSRDTPSDDPRDPGRVGTGRDGTGTPTPLRQEELHAREDEQHWPTTPAPVPEPLAAPAPAALARPRPAFSPPTRCASCRDLIGRDRSAQGHTLCLGCEPIPVGAK